MAQIRVHFVTNRDHRPNNEKEVFGPRFNPDGVAALRYGVADFTSTPGKAATLDKVTVYKETKSAEGFTVQGSDAFLEDLRQAMKGERSDTIVFVHGFNVSFIGALNAGAQLAAQVTVDARPVNVVVFSWPSDGSAVPLMSYYSDREDARASGAAIARAFLRLRDYVLKLDAEKYCDRRIHLLAHSMGNYVLRHGLQALIAKDPNNLTRLFDQILMAAPDEDDDAFESDSKLRLLPRIGRQVTTYFNRKDKALLISDKTKANPDRLGSDGPRLADLIPKKIALVDCRHVASFADPRIEHSYYINSPAVSSDIAAILAGLEPEAIPNREYVPADRAFRIKMEL